MDIIGSIKRRSREEWIQLFRQKWLDIRIAVQENGEAALVAGIVGGILFVLAFRLFVAIAVIATLVAFLILNIAESEGELKSQASIDPEIKSSAVVTGESQAESTSKADVIEIHINGD